MTGHPSSPHSHSPSPAEPEQAGPDGVMPVVERPGGGVPLPVVVASAVLAGLLLFGVLDARRRSTVVPTVREPATAVVGGAPLPELFIPPDLPPPPPPPPQAVASTTPMPSPRFYPSSPPEYDTLYRPPSIAQQQQAQSSGPPRMALVFDNPTPSDPALASVAAPAAGSGLNGGGRVESGILANPATTVPQGTVIAAVLESAIDSSRASQVTALVQRDVRGFDGAQVLIPRGSRLIGELRTEMLPGQSRANVIWTRLLRPDGATIALQSPAADPLGRGGIQGKVDGHFWARFGETMLQSTLDLGTDLALSGRRRESVVVFSGIGRAAASGAAATRVQAVTAPPTITVAAGRSVSVAVLRDLDFTRVGR